jgi:SAM-dependent methyltransferase
MQPLFDPNSVRRNRQRALAGSEPALFLHDLVADQISERLAEVNKTFNRIAIITPFIDLWRTRFPDAVMVHEHDHLDLGNGPYDLIIHALSLHWSNDPVGQMIQCQRVLRPDGLFLAALFGGRSLQELRIAMAEAETLVSGGIRPRVAPMAEIRDLGGLLQRAGLALPVADSEMLTLTYADFHALAHDLRAMGETNAVADRQKTMTTRAMFEKAAEIYAAHFSTSDGRISATAELIYLTGWKPSADQPKPLMPGSAQMRLAEALGVSENTDPGEHAKSDESDP